ncbi:leader peptidase (prepilin peptidase) / N-methyltransferase [Polynucleobacter meluiroseus]|uniref:Leader peptidase (Prepilin peptidase) / N-methyltransferase n=1 Tax=Polynucleobacter meluiroseus TaxID=1938814 RepID=A0A240E282_9BURK|nr:A24 family peptidase [Polynucleobacter meluiroseus]SNX28980.1 leader peptidase (prepilin peptidase) / N-methyltransferase [Polynucleobacter meluiroseus]
MGLPYPALLAAIFLVTLLAYLAYVDLRTFRLPDRMTIPLIGTGISFNYLSPYRLTDLDAALLGASLGYAFIWLLNKLFRLLKQQDGIGMGDAKLLAGLGAWLGWLALPRILFLASIIGLLGGILWLKLNKKNYKQAFPFGPFLAIAGIIELLCSQIIPPFLSISLISVH